MAVRARARYRVWVRAPLVLLLLALTACGGADTPSAAELSAPPIDASPDSSDLIEIRTLVVSWTGAEDTAPDLERTEAVAQQRAETIAALVRQSASNFGEVAREYADEAPRVERLERGAEDLDPAIASVAFRLRVGQVGGPVRTTRGYVVMQRRPDPQVGPSDVQARHILILFEGSRAANETTTRSREEARLRADEVYRRARDGEDWNTLHARYSEEPNGPEGGDLGTFGRGQMTPSFERAAFGLEVGATSEPVESPFGFHIIQRTR